MNQENRKRLWRLKQLITAIPYPHDGGSKSSVSIAGLAGYQSDMRNLLPALARVIEGITYSGIDELEEGEDYEDPDELMADIEAWIEKRKCEDWTSVPTYDFENFRKRETNDDAAK
jgi:hypothetical protein